MFEELTFPETAFLSAFYAYFVKNGIVQFQVWRPGTLTRSASNSYTLLAKFDFTVTEAPGLFGVSAYTVKPVYNDHLMGVILCLLELI